MKQILLIAALLLANYCNAQDSLDVAYVKTKGGQWEIIDRTGRILADSLFEHDSLAVLNCSEGMAITERGGKFGFIDLFNGNRIACNYDTVSAFKHVTMQIFEAAVHINNQWHAISRYGAMEYKQSAKGISDHYMQPLPAPSTCKAGYCLVETDSLINCQGPDGKMLLAKSDVFVAPWNDVNSFINDRILKYKVMANKICSCHKMTSYYGFIDRNGTWVIEPNYEQADIFSFGMAAIGIGAEEMYAYGYIGMDGNWIIKPVYKEAGRFMRLPRQEK